MNGRADGACTMRTLRVGLAVLLACALAGCGHDASHAATPTPTRRTADATRLPDTVVFGRILALDPTGWTLKGIKGNIYVVTLARTTDYGTLFHRARRSQFTVGDRVRVVGIFVGRAVTANDVQFAPPPRP